MKKLFVSQPMNGLTADEIVAERNRIVLAVQEHEGESMEPLKSYFTNFHDDDAKNRSVYCLGCAITILADADVAAFGPGWQDARGCKIEHLICERYGIPTIEV